MIPLRMEHLINCFEEAQELNTKYVAVAVRVPNAPKVEIIINEQDNIEEKLAYYQKTYDSDLSHNAVGDILKIVGVTYGDSFAEIEAQLKGGEDN